MYYAMILLIENSLERLISLFLSHFFLSVVVLFHWYHVERIDPIEIKDEITPQIKCFKRSKVSTRYCGTCHKSVAGLDHHCLWLNTCIGSKNYISFFILILTGFLQTTLQVIIGILYLTLWSSPSIHSK